MPTASPSSRRAGGRAVGLLLCAVVLGGAGRAVPAAHDEPATRIFGDWLAACDNRLDCSVLGFGNDDLASALILTRPRTGAPGLELVLHPDRSWRPALVRLQPARRGPAVTVRLAAAGGEGPWRGPLSPGAASVLLGELAGGGRLLLSRAEPHADAIGAIRLNGAAAALDWVAERQRHAPEPAAVVDWPAQDPGAGTASRMPGAVAALASVRACRLQDADDPGHDVGGWRLSAATTLWQVPCGSGNFDTTSLFVLADGAKTEPAAFAAPRPLMVRPPGQLANAQVEAGGAGITATEPSRGLGDCGDVRRYRWDGQRYRLILARSMPLCRGLAPEDWPVVYRLQAPAE